MDPLEIEREGYLERWLSGRLADPQRAAYEAHWFRSDDAFDELERGLAIRSALAAADAPPMPPAA